MELLTLNKHIFLIINYLLRFNLYIKNDKASTRTKVYANGKI